MTNTVRVPFHRCGDAKQALFAVQANLPVAEALDSAHSLLDIAETLALHGPGVRGPVQAQINHACHFLISAAKATLQACIESKADEKAA